jgi:hypothetical protein
MNRTFTHSPAVTAWKDILPTTATTGGTGASFSWGIKGRLPLRKAHKRALVVVKFTTVRPESAWSGKHRRFSRHQWSAQSRHTILSRIASQNRHRTNEGQNTATRYYHRRCYGRFGFTRPYRPKSTGGVGSLKTPPIKVFPKRPVHLQISNRHHRCLLQKPARTVAISA